MILKWLFKIILLAISVYSQVFFGNSSGLLPQRQVANYFENSTRQNLNLYQLSGILMVYNEKSHGICTGFFIKNKMNKLFVMTQQHCAGYEIEKYCDPENQDQPKLKFISYAISNQFALCKRVVARATFNDMVLIEVQFQKPVQYYKKIKFYQIADFKPVNGLPLNLIGHPKDSLQHGVVTLSKNCWVLSEKKPRVNQKIDYMITPENTVIQIRNKILQESFWQNSDFANHNCNIYAGNSGGPVILENTDIVLGIPSVYLKDQVKVLNSDESLRFETTFGFINAIKEKLTTEGVILFNDLKSIQDEH